MKSKLLLIKIVLSVCFIGISGMSYAQWRMSIAGSYNFTTFDLHDNFHNGFGAHAAAYYYFNEAPFTASVSFGVNKFNAHSEYENAIEQEQHLAIDFDYKVRTYSVPMFVGADFHLFREKRIQALVGIDLGVNAVTYKVKQIGNYTSDTEKDIQYQFGIYPHIGAVIRVADDMGILVKGGCNRTFGDRDISYADLRLGLVYKI